MSDQEHCTPDMLEDYFSDSIAENVEAMVSEHLIGCETCRERAVRISDAMLSFHQFAATTWLDGCVVEVLPEALQLGVEATTSVSRRRRLHFWHEHVQTGGRTHRRPHSYSVRCSEPRAAVQNVVSRAAGLEWTSEAAPVKIKVEETVEVVVNERKPPVGEGWLVMLVPVEGSGRVPLVGELAPAQRGHDAVFPGVPPGEYYVVFEPESGGDDLEYRDEIEY